MNKVKKVIKKVKEGFLKEALCEVVWIYKLTAEYKGKICMYIFAGLLSMVITMYFNVQVKNVVDYLVLGQWNEVIQIVIVYITIGIVNVLFAMIMQRISELVATNVRANLSKCVYDKVLAADWEELIHIHSGDLMNRIQSDVASIASSVVGWVPNIVLQILQTLVAFSIIVYYDVSMVIVVGTVLPIMVLGSRIFLRKTYEANRRQRIVTSSLSALYKDSFQNMQAIKAFNLRTYFYRKLEAMQDEKVQIDLEVNKNSVLSWSVMYVSGQFAALICLGWAVYHVYTGVITLGTMTLMFMLAGTISSGFKSMVQMIPTAMSTITSSERVRGVLGLCEETMEDIDEFYQESIKEGVGLDVNEMSFSYLDGKKVFENVSFHVNVGETIALVGPSGEGKTTMLRILLGIVKTKAGCVNYVLGNTEKKLQISASSRKLISYVPQGNTMMNGTIAENLRMMNQQATDQEIIEALEKACAYEFVQKLPDGIYHIIGESGVGFSEGQNQRLAIARALLSDAPILLLDEATSALDVVTERKVIRNLMDIDAKRTCILTTHRPSVLSICDKVYRIADTKVTLMNETEIEKLRDEF